MFKFNPKLLRAAVYGANDGVVTTFAVVAGVSGAGLSHQIILVLGVANMIADGLSMGLSDYLAEVSEQRMRRKQHDHYSKKKLWQTGLTTFGFFVLAGMFPLLPYLLGAIGLEIPVNQQFLWSILATAFALFTAGGMRTIVIGGAWLRNSLEMLAIGTIASSAAYILGAGIKALVGVEL